MIREDIKTWVSSTLSVDSVFSVDHPKDMSHGDYAINVALIEGKKQGRNPKELAEEYVKMLSEKKLGTIEKIEVAGPGFINIFLTKDFFAESVDTVLNTEEKFGENTFLAGDKIFIEHTQPNPFKEFHIGHLMNNAIGESIVRIVRAQGAEVKVASYHGDKGLHVAKTIWAMMSKKGGPWNISDIGQMYKEGSSAYEMDSDLKVIIESINKKIYDRTDDDVNQLYDKYRTVSLDYFESLYKKLDSHFDFHFYESESGEIGKKIVLEHEPGIFEKGDNGAIVFHGENFEPKTHTRVFLNSEGLPTYEAKEVGLAQIKKDAFPYNFSLTVTANEQDAFFNVVEVAIGEVFCELKGKLKHVSHGMLKLPTGKMSSRTGTVISAESMIEDVKEKVLEKMADRDMSEEKKHVVSEIVAIGAIKYSILKQAIGGDIIFDFDKSLSFEGDSGPYLQYAYVRSQSILKRIKNKELRIKIPEGWGTTALEKMLARFPEVVERAGSEYAPHHIATYLTELASSFNGFYADHKIVDESDVTSPYRVALTGAFAQVMKNGLNLLGIKVPDEM